MVHTVLGCVRLLEIRLLVTLIIGFVHRYQCMYLAKASWSHII